MFTTRRLRMTTGFCAIAFLLVGLCLFLLWAFKAEVEHLYRWRGGAPFVWHRVVGPPGPAIAALWPSLFGVAMGLDWLLTGALRRPRSSASQPAEQLYHQIAAFQGAALVVLLVPGFFIAIVGASQLILAPEMGRRLARYDEERPAREARESLSMLVKQLKDPDVSVRAHAAESIGAMDPDLARDAVYALIPLLRDEDSVAMAAAKTLGELGRYSKLAESRLGTLLDSGASRRPVEAATGGDPLRLCAAEALAKIGAEEELLSRLDHANPDIRWYAAYGLGLTAQSTGESGHAIRRLKEALKNEDDEHVRGAIREALGKLDPHEPP